MENKKITSEHSVRLIDNHESTLCKKAGSQLNSTGRLRKYFGFSEIKALIEAFVFLNFNYCPLVWHFTSMTSTNKIESIQKRALRRVFVFLGPWPSAPYVGPRPFGPSVPWPPKFYRYSFKE